jgi:hypothetical protein
MTYRDEIVDEVRAIREQICKRAGSLENILNTLRSEEAANTGRIAKRRHKASGIVREVAMPLCAEDKANYGSKKL